MPRSIACLSVGAILLGTSLGAAHAAAVPPTPNLPFTHQDCRGLHGLSLVDGDDFSQVATVVPVSASISQARVVYGVDDPRPAFAVFQQDGHWMRVDLRAGLDAPAHQVSSEAAANTVCGATVKDTRVDAPRKAWLIYRLPSAKGCSDPSGPFRRITLDDDAATAPVDLPLATLDFTPVRNRHGRVAYVLGADRATLVRYDADLGAATVLADDTRGYRYWGQSADGAALVTLHDDLHRLTPAGRLVRTPLVASDPGYSIAQAIPHDGFVYVNEVALDNTSGLPAFRSLVVRVPIDGSARETPLLRFDGAVRIGGFTDSRVIVATSVPPPIDGPSQVKLQSLALDGQGEPILLYDTQAADRSYDGGVTIVDTLGDRVFFSVGLRSEDDGATLDIAYVARDTGDTIHDFGDGSAWIPAPSTVDAFAPQTFAHHDDLLLQVGATTGSSVVQGGRLEAVHEEDLSEHVLAHLKATSEVRSVAASARSNLGTIVGRRVDVFAVDLAGRRFGRIPRIGRGDPTPLQ